ncbi:MAG TPA: S-layer homology domain-containing protein [Fimbriimonas sp.]
MKRLALLLAASLACSAFAQNGAPPDVPRNHWAFDAVDTLFREGLLKGYPDGTFKGSRPLSRYELAAVLAGMNRNLQSRLDAIKAGTVKATPQERAQIEAQLRAIRGEVDALKPMKGEIDELTQRLLAMRSRLGTMRSDVDDLRKRTAELDKKR